MKPHPNPLPVEAFRLLGKGREDKWPPRILRVLAI
jgi:hypothetical protein